MLTFTVFTTAVYTMFRAIYNYQERIQKEEEAMVDEGLDLIKEWMHDWTPANKYEGVINASDLFVMDCKGNVNLEYPSCPIDSKINWDDYKLPSRPSDDSPRHFPPLPQSKPKSWTRWLDWLD